MIHAAHLHPRQITMLFPWALLHFPSFPSQLPRPRHQIHIPPTVIHNSQRPNVRLFSVMVPFPWHNDSPNTICTHNRIIARSSQYLPYPSNLQNSPRPRGCALVAAHPPGGFGSGRMGECISGGIKCQPYGHEIECILCDTLVESLWGFTVSAYYDGRVGVGEERRKQRATPRDGLCSSLAAVSGSTVN